MGVDESRNLSREKGFQNQEVEPKEAKASRGHATCSKCEGRFQGGNCQESLTQNEEQGVGSAEAGKQLLIEPSFGMARAIPDTSRP